MDSVIVDTTPQSLRSESVSLFVLGRNFFSGSWVSWRIWTVYYILDDIDLEKKIKRECVCFNSCRSKVPKTAQMYWAGTTLVVPTRNWEISLCLGRTVHKEPKLNMLVFKFKRKLFFSLYTSTGLTKCYYVSSQKIQILFIDLNYKQSLAGSNQASTEGGAQQLS